MEKMLADRYMIVTSLGGGGMADVYLAIDTILNREVAIKVLRGELSNDPVALLRFLREASAVSKLQHPNVVEVYDVGEYDKKNYIVMEYVRGRTLKQLISQRGALTKEEAVDIMKQLVSAVAHAHENNIIHRDIKPQNVLVKDDGTIKITDFGIALAHDSVQLTQADSVLGSAHYIAPETTRGESATVQIDIYALGIVFYELLTGSVPFNGDNPVQIAMKHLREDVPSVKDFNPTLPQSIDNIIIRATAKNRLNRYQSAKEMLDDLEMCLLPEFANVDKVVFEELDKEGSGTRVYNPVEDTKETDTHEYSDDEDEEYEEEDTSSNKKKKSKKKKKKDSPLKKVLIAFIVVALLGAGTAAVYFSDIIPGFSAVKKVEVPDLSNMTQEEAEQALEDVNLVLGDVEYEVTDDVDEGLVYEQSTAKGEEVKEGTKINITISSGIYFVVGNYVGMTLDAAEASLPDYVTVLTDYEENSSYTPGTIIEQSLLSQGDKLEPNVSKQIRFTVVSAPQFVMADYTGAKIETAKATLEKLGATVVLQQMDKPETGDDDTEQVEEGVVIKQTPEVGSYYTQEGDKVVTLYYY